MRQQIALRSLTGERARLQVDGHVGRFEGTGRHGTLSNAVRSARTSPCVFTLASPLQRQIRCGFWSQGRIAAYAARRLTLAKGQPRHPTPAIDSHLSTSLHIPERTRPVADYAYYGDFLVAVPVKKKKNLAPQAPFRARKLSGKV